MAYEPRRKMKWNGKILLLLLAVCVTISAFTIYYFIRQEEEVQQFNVCGFSHEKSKDRLEVSYRDTYELKDYLFYGESLDLFHGKYNMEESDELAGKTVILRDLCSDKEYAFVIRNTIDSQIMLHNIKKGYYEVFVVENLKEKRVVFQGNSSDSITTIHRNNANLKVELLADQNYFNQKGVSLPQNYLFIKVSKTTLPEKDYDIAIDPGKLDTDFQYVTDEGGSANGLIEYQETYRAALELKERFEAAGLKVLLVREEEEEVNSYGENGRLHRAYQANTKYYLRLSFEETTYDYDGMSVTYSAHANGTMSDQVIYYIKRNCGVAISSLYNTMSPGSFTDGLLQSKLDGRYYDADLWIREAGGMATQAGCYSENAKEGTAAFAKDNRHGIYAVTINLGYISSQSDTQYWKNHREEYMDAMAEGFIQYWNLNQE